MNKKDIIFLATALMLSSNKFSAPTDTLKSSYLDWFRVLSEVYEECQTDPQN